MTSAAQMPRAIEREPGLEMNTQDAQVRKCAIAQAPSWRHHAGVGVVHGLGVWWRNFGLNKTNVNQFTSQNLTDYNSRRCDRGETDIIRASEALVSGSIPDGRTKHMQALDFQGLSCFYPR